MAAARQWRVDGTRNSEYLAARVGGEFCRDERAALAGCFHDQYAARQAGDDAIALWKPLGKTARAQWKFGHQGALCGDLVRQIAVFGRIHDINACAQAGMGAAAVREIGRAACRESVGPYV